MSKKFCVRYLIFTLFVLFATTAKSVGTLPTDSLEAELLTCAPGEEVYEYYGHSAIRIRNLNAPNEADDYVFHYGLFDFNTPHFVWRFVKGECDYKVGLIPYHLFLYSYEQRGSQVRALRLNLTQEEISRLLQALITNCEPQNATYRYNFFYDNCATRIVDQIAHCLNGKLVYTNPVKPQSLRDIVHQYSASHPWSLFGQDLLLGAEADRPATRRMQQFAPLYLEQDLSTALIEDSLHKTRPLVAETYLATKGESTPDSPTTTLTPFVMAIGLFILTIILSVWDWKRGKKSWWFDALLLTAQGVTGCIVAFLFFFSQHPTVDSNWLVIMFNPLPLIFLFHTIKAEIKGRIPLYYKCSAPILGIFFLTSFIMPQHFGNEIPLLALSLLIRSIVCIITPMVKRPSTKLS